MKTRLLFSIALSLMIGLSGCHSNQNQSDYCTVKGTVNGLPDGTKLELLDKFNHWEVVGTGSVKKGAFEIHPDVSSPTHVYLYVQEGLQMTRRISKPVPKEPLPTKLITNILHLAVVGIRKPPKP